MVDPGGSDRVGAGGVGSDLRIWRGRWWVGPAAEIEVWDAEGASASGIGFWVW